MRNIWGITLNCINILQPVYFNLFFHGYLLLCIYLFLQKNFGGTLWKNTGRIDGDKWMCLDEKYNIKPKDCLIFSFGINNEWSFDDEMDKFGCKVC